VTGLGRAGYTAAVTLLLDHLGALPPPPVPGYPMTERLDRIRAAMADEGWTLWISSPVDDVFGKHSMNRRYVSGSPAPRPRAHTRDAFLAVDSRYVRQAEREAKPADSNLPLQGPLDQLGAEIRARQACPARTSA
jgi:hypothetical protein